MNQNGIFQDSLRIPLAKKIQVSFSDKQIELIHQLKGELGNSESEIVRTIVTCWLSEQGFIGALVKEKIANNSQGKTK